MNNNPDTKYCRECGQSMHAADRYCNRCGADQRDADAESATPEDTIPTASHETQDTQRNDTTDWGKMMIYAAVVVGSLLLLFYGLTVLSGIASGSPDGTVEEYWNAVDEGDLERADELTADDLNYDSGDSVTFERGNIEVREVEVRSNSDGEADVYAEILLENQRGSWQLWGVDHDLEKQDGDWVITNADEEVLDASR